MSSMLKEAIVDAKALRESALKSAENVIIEKYSDEVRKTIEHILEQEEAPLDLGLEPEMAAPGEEMPVEDPAMGDISGMDVMEEDPLGEPAEEVVMNEDDLPFAATDDLSTAKGQNLSSFPSTGEEVEISIDLGTLQEALKELQDNEEVEINIDEALVDDDDDDDDDNAEEAEAGALAVAADSDAMKNANLEENTLDLDSIATAIAEKLTVDMGAELSGWAGTPTSQLKYEQQRALAAAQSDDVKEELEDLNKAQEKLVAENNQLKEQNTKYKQAVLELQEGLQDVNLSNARLLYTNRVLRNTSLNERQKTKVVEAISGAGSVTEARTIFDTLQSTVESTPMRRPQSLSEAIGRNRASVIRATRKESTVSDPFQDRMKRLAGIK
jgi:hypothetical protein